MLLCCITLSSSRKTNTSSRCSLEYRKTNETDLCWRATVKTEVLFIGRGVAYRKTGLHRILFISPVDLLHPPRATVDLLQPPRAPVHPASTARYSTGYCSTTPPRAPLHRLLFIHPSTGTPTPSIVHPALHGVVLFIQPSTGSCSSSPNRLDRGNATGSCSSTPTAHCSSKPPPPPRNAHYSSREAASTGFS